MQRVGGELMPSHKTGGTSELRRRLTFDWKDVGFRVALPVLAMLAAMLIGAAMLLALKANALHAYAALVVGVFGSVYGFTQSLVKATPLLLVGLGICISFRASVINIGGEGQIIAGALMATWFSLAFRAWPGWLPAPRNNDHGISCRGRVGLHPRHPEGSIERQRDTEHRDDERHRNPVDEFSFARSAY